MADLRSLNTAQKTAVTHEKGPLLVVAGAGTGKTRVITDRIAYLVERQGIPQREILAITFTDKAANEMEDRLSQLLNTYNLDVNITTFNSYGDNLLKRFAFDLGITPKFRLMSSTQQLVFLKDHIDELELDYYSPVTRPEAMLGVLAEYFSQLKSNLITPETYQKYLKETRELKGSELSRHQELARAYARYCHLCRAQDVIDFDDQVYLTVELLKKRPNVKEKVRSEIKHILVDEYQDTNLLQSELLKQLVEPDGNIMVVGDDDQCIYNFRGAAISNILSFKEDYPKAQETSLTENYRSTQAILDAAYRLIQHNNPNRLEAKYNIDKHLRAKKQGTPPRLEQFKSVEDEAQWVASDVAERLKQGETASEIAILLRKNNQAKLLQKYLDTEGVEYVVLGESQNLYRQPEIKLLIWLIKAIADPSNSESLYHVLASELYDFPPTWLRDQAAKARREHKSLEQVLGSIKKNEPHAEEAANVAGQLKQWRGQLSQVSVGRLCYSLLEDTGYLRSLLGRAKDEPEIDARIAHLNQFFTTMLEFERIAQDNSAINYLDNLPNLMEAGEKLQIEDLPDIFGEKVRILTVHKAKGLEFETIYLFDLTQGTFPGRNIRSSLEVPPALLAIGKDVELDEHLAEERRLMYVALTRAKRNVLATYSLDHGGKRAKKPSVFVSEIFGEDLARPLVGPKRLDTGQIELFKDSTRPTVPLPEAMLDGEWLRLTARQIEDYLMCPTEFYFRHILKPPLPTSFAMEYGSLIHDLIQIYNQRKRDGEPIDLKMLVDYLDKHWPQEGYISLAHHHRGRKQAADTLKRFLERETKSTRTPAYIEQPFQFELSEQKVLVRGRFDAVYDDGTTEIRDYKTGGANIDSKDKAESRARSSTQLAIYALAWEQIKGKTPDTVSLDFVDAGYIGKAAKTVRQLETTRDKISKTAEGIRANKFEPAKSHLFCLHQEYGL